MSKTRPNPVVDLSTTASKSVDSHKMQNLSETAINKLRKQAKAPAQQQAQASQQKKQELLGDLDQAPHMAPEKAIANLSDQATVPLSDKKMRNLGEQAAKRAATIRKREETKEKANLTAIKEDLDRAPAYAVETPIHDLSDTAVLRLKTGSMQNLRGSIGDGHGLSAKEIAQQSSPADGSARSTAKDSVRMEFTKDLETHVEIMDLQHKEYFETMNKLLEECAEGMTPEDLHEAFHFLDFFTIQHFATEEDLMKEYKYPAYQEHHARHQEFRTELDNLKKRFRYEGMTDALVMRLNYLLVEWFVKQVRIDDKKLSHFLRGKSKNKFLVKRLADLVKNFTRYSR